MQIQAGYRGEGCLLLEPQVLVLRIRLGVLLEALILRKHVVRSINPVVTFCPPHAVGHSSR